MAGQDRSKSFAAAHPIGQSNQTKSNQHKSFSNMTDEAQEKQQNTVDTAKKIASAPVDFLKWLYDNWQLATIGIVALYVLLKD